MAASEGCVDFTKGKWYLIVPSDAKFDKDGNFIGMKRKYGKFKRPIYKFK